jgi:hypothetical protein
MAKISAHSGGIMAVSLLHNGRRLPAVLPADKTFFDVYKPPQSARVAG